MKFFGLCLLTLLIFTSGAFAQMTPASPASYKDKTSYALGVNLIGNLRQQGVDVDLESLLRGMRDAFSGAELAMSDEDIKIYLTRYQNEVRNKQAKTRAVAAEINKKAETAFFAENARKEGIVALSSGLQYKVLRKGEGKTPRDADMVEIKYRATTIKGGDIDSSERLGKPLVAKVKGTMPGLSEALKLMQVGAKWQLFIPARLAFGDRGNGNLVGPNEAVVYEVELVAIQ